VQFPDDPRCGPATETIYQSLYVYPRGGLRRELKASLRSGRAARRPRGRGPEARGKITAAVPIGQRPPEVQGRLVPGHTEGDLVMGTVASNSAVGTHRRRTTGYLTLLHLPDGHTADAVASAVISRLAEYPAWFARTLTWDNGRKWPATPASPSKPGSRSTSLIPTPWQRGSNENTNGLLASTSPGHRPVPAHRRPAPGHPRRAQTTAPENGSASTPHANSSLNSSKQERVATTP